MFILQMVGLLGRVISSSQGLYLNTGQHKHRINAYTHTISMPCVGFEPAIPASERAKTVHALNRSATVTGRAYLNNGELTKPLVKEAVCWSLKKSVLIMCTIYVNIKNIFPTRSICMFHMVFTTNSYYFSKQHLPDVFQMLACVFVSQELNF
jgi:hypothetical protein